MTATLPSISDSVLAEVVTHAGSDLDREVGGILVGRASIESTDIEAAIPALKAESSHANVTFTHDVWAELLTKVDAEYPTLGIVGWYHSHPGFGVFLSSYDEFIHQNFFPSPGMVALVVDPKSGVLGWFGWEDQRIVRLDSETPKVLPSVPERSAALVRIVGLGVVAALVALLAGWGARGLFGSRNEPKVMRPDAVAMEREPVSDKKVIKHRVREGDTLGEIAARYLGSVNAYPQIVKTNPGMDPDALNPGQVITVVVPLTRRLSRSPWNLR